MYKAHLPADLDVLLQQMLTTSPACPVYVRCSTNGANSLAIAEGVSHTCTCCPWVMAKYFPSGEKAACETGALKVI